MANRIEKLAADIRDGHRRLDGFSHIFSSTYTEDTPSATGPRRVRLVAELAELSDQHAYWEAVRVEQITTGQATGHSRDTIKKGDRVKIRGQWRDVVRANAKTVSVTTGYSWTDTTPDAEI